MKRMSPLSQMNDLLGGHVPRQEADRLRGEPSLAPVGSSAPSLTFPLFSFNPSPLQPINPIPWASKETQKAIFLFSFLVWVFIFYCVDSCSDRLTYLPASISSLSCHFHPLPPPRSQGTSLITLITLLCNTYGKDQTLQHGIQPPDPHHHYYNLLSTALSALLPLFLYIYPIFEPNSSESSNLPSRQSSNTPMLSISASSGHITSSSA